MSSDSGESSGQGSWKEPVVSSAIGAAAIQTNIATFTCSDTFFQSNENLFLRLGRRGIGGDRNPGLTRAQILARGREVYNTHIPETVKCQNSAAAVEGFVEGKDYSHIKSHSNVMKEHNVDQMKNSPQMDSAQKVQIKAAKAEAADVKNSMGFEDRAANRARGANNASWFECFKSKIKNMWEADVKMWRGDKGFLQRIGGVVREFFTFKNLKNSLKSAAPACAIYSAVSVLLDFIEHKKYKKFDPKNWKDWKDLLIDFLKRFAMGLAMALLFMLVFMVLTVIFGSTVMYFVGLILAAFGVVVLCWKIAKCGKILFEELMTWLQQRTKSKDYSENSLGYLLVKFGLADQYAFEESETPTASAA